MASPVFVYRGELLHQASIFDQMDLLKSLLQAGAQGDVNSRDPRGLTPVHTAAVHDSVHCLEELLKWDGDPNALSGDSLCTPLHLAARNGHLRCLKVLIDGGANTEIRNKGGKNATQIALAEEHYKCVNYLTTVEAIKKAAREEEARQELFRCCVEGDAAKVRELLTQVNQSSLSQIYDGGSTLLYKASRGGHFEIVKLLLDNGASGEPNAFTGVTPLYAACFEGHVEVTRLLVHKMPQLINIPGKMDNSAPLHVAAGEGREAIVKILLQSEEPGLCSGVDLNAVTFSGMTPLHLAAQGGFLRVIKQLVDCEHKCTGPCKASTEVHIDVRSIMGRTALHDAITVGHRDVVKYLVGHGANINLPVDIEQSQTGGESVELTRVVRQLAEDSSPITPLEIACCHGDALDMVLLLLDKGAEDVGNRCLEVACKANNDALVSLLLRKGVHVDQENKFSSRGIHAAEEAWKQTSDGVSILWSNLKMAKILDQWVTSAASFINPHIEAVEGGPHPVLRTITRLDISENHLKILPLVIFQLPCLKILNASKNSLCIFPSRRPAVQKEKERSHNGLSNGKMSASCDNLGEGSDTEDIDFTYAESSWNCPHLEELELQNNSFITLPTCLFQLPSLKYLSVAFNDIKTVPFAMWTAPVLKRLDLKGNYLKKLPLIKGRALGMHSKASTLPRAKVFTAQRKDDLKPKVHEGKRPKEDVNHPQKLKIFCHRQLWGSRGIDELEDSDSDEEDFDPGQGAALQKLDISKNNLQMVPRGLPCLAPNLTTLILSHNSIEEVATLSLFPTSLGTLDLSHNKLKQFRPFSDDLASIESKCYSPFEGQRTIGRPRASTESVLGTSARVRFCRHARHQLLPQLKRLDLNNNKVQDLCITLLGRRYHSYSTDSSTPKPYAVAWHKQRGTVVDQREELLFPSLQSLSVDYNPLVSLPRQIGSLSKLGSLHINHTEITKLPDEVGLLSELWDLQYQGITLQDIEPSVLERKKTCDIVGYLRSVLEKSRPYPSMKLMFVGVSNIGKTTLLNQLRLEGTSSASQNTAPVTWTERQNRKKASTVPRKGKQDRNVSTVGVDVCDWVYPKKADFAFPGRGDARPSIKFSTWDFGGQREYYATHQCFLSHRSLYIAMWKVTDGERGVSEIEPWLLNIQARAMDSPVIIVGTHYDLLSTEERKSDYLTTLRQMIRERYIAMEFGGGVQTPRERGLPKVMAFIEVSCKTGYHIKDLRQLIYNKAFEIKKKGSQLSLMETPVPASYIAVEEAVIKLRIKCYRDDQTPIMKSQQFRDNIEIELQKQDVHLRDTEELEQATRFLHDNGVLLHYNGPLLRDLYFLDPQWLCDMLAHVVTIREVNPHINNGVMRLADLSHIFRSENFPANLMKQYINLLSKFEVALRWSQEYLLVPSLLPCKQEETNQPVAPGVSHSVAQAMSAAAYTRARVLRRQYVMSYVPSGFWPRLITRVIADERVRSVVRSSCQLLSDGPVDEKEQSKLETTAQPGWSCWKSGIELTCFGVKLLRVWELEGLPFYGAPEEAVHLFHFRDEVHDTSGYSTVEIITPCVSIDMEKFEQKRKLANNRGNNDRGETRRMVGFRVKTVSDSTVQYSARLLTIVVEHIDTLITDWFPGLDTLTVHGYRLVTRLIPCPMCITAASAVATVTSADQETEGNDDNMVVPPTVNSAPQGSPLHDSGTNLTTDGSSASASPWPSPVHGKASPTSTSPSRKPGAGESLPRQGGAVISERLEELATDSIPQTPPDRKTDVFSFGSVSSGHGTDESSSYVENTSDQSSGSRDSDSSCGQPPPYRTPSRKAASSGSEESRGSEGSVGVSSRGADTETEGTMGSRKWSRRSVGSAGSGFQRSGNYGSFRRRPTQEDVTIYAFEFEECVLCAFVGKPMVCKEHGELQLRDLAPDAVFEDIAPNMNIQANDLIRGKFQGKGTFGSVFRGKLKQACGDYEIVAMKMPLNNEVDDQAKPEERQAAEAAKRALRDSPTLTLNDAYRTIRQEISILLPLRHPHIVALLGHCLNPFCMVLEFAPEGALDRVLSNYKKAGARLDAYVMQKCIVQCSSALRYLHKHNIIYRDLKSENILVWLFPTPFSKNQRGQEVLIKLADYGISRSAALTGMKGLGGTPGFMAPEIEKYVGKEVYTNKVDSFSFGMYIYELVTLHQPFFDLNPAQVKQMVVEGHRPPLTAKDKRAPVFALDLMAWCWQQEAETRPPSSYIFALASTPEFPRLADVLTFDKQLGLNCAVTAGSRLSLGCGVDGRPSVGGELWLCRSELNAGIGTGKISIVSYSRGRLQHKQELKVGKSCIRVACSVGSTVWLGTESGSLFVYCAVTYKLLCQGFIKSKKYVLRMIHVPRCNSVLVALQDGSVLSYNDNICNHYHYPDATSQKRVHELTHSRVYHGNGNPVHCMAALPIRYPNMVASATSPDATERVEDDAKDELVCEVWCGQEKGEITVLDGDELSKISTMPAEDCGPDSQTLKEQSVSHLETCRTFGSNISMGDPVARSVWVALFPGTRVFRWDAKERSVVGSVDCSLYTPKLDDPRNRVPLTRPAHRASLVASRAQVNSLVAVDKELYIGTSWGCVLVCNNLSLMVYTVIRPHEESVKQLLPLTTAPVASQHSSDKQTALIISCGRGYRRLGGVVNNNSQCYPSRQSRKNGASLAKNESVLLVWLADAWEN